MGTAAPFLHHDSCVVQYYTKLEAQNAADAVSRTPEAAASALGTAGEIVAGVAGHIVDKVGGTAAAVQQHS